MRPWEGRSRPIEQDDLRLRAQMIAAGVYTTYLICAAIGIWLALTWSQPNRTPMAVMLVLAFGAAVIISRLPADRIVRSRFREAFFLTWSVLDIGLIATLAGLDGGVTSPSTVVFFLTVVFAALSYPLQLVAIVSVLNLATFVALGLLASPGETAQPDAAYIWLFSITLALASVMCVWQARMQSHQRGELGRASRTDPLTGSLNRRGIEERLDDEIEAATESWEELSLIVLDLDHFKEVNDTLGHAAGDELLCWIVNALGGLLRPEDAVGRLGGDEFAVILPNLERIGADAVARRLRRTLNERIAVTTGLASFPLDGRTRAELQRQADADLYAAKRKRAGLLPTDVSGEGPSQATRRMIERVLEVAGKRLGTELVCVTEVDGERQTIRSHHGDIESFGFRRDTEMALEGGSCRLVVSSGEPVVVRDARNDERTRDLAATWERDVRAYVGVPVRLSDGGLYGTLFGVSHSPVESLASDVVTFVEVLADVVAHHVESSSSEHVRRRVDSEAIGVHALITALEARDRYTRDHSAKVVVLSAMVARELGLGERDILEVEQVARLHDIGKIGIPDAILQKPGPLSQAEWTLMREHPTIGAQIVASIPSLARLAPPIRAEHERWDGGGYPHGLAGEQIPLASRIVLACDAYHAMTSDRPYRDSMSPEEARRELEEEAGSQFDPAVVAALLRILVGDRESSAAPR
jgi:diguanylate cyclase (GGDEF)-like protein